MLSHSFYDVLLVAGIDAVGLARFPFVLHKAGCRVTLLSPHGFAISRSRFVNQHIATSTDANARVLHLKSLLEEKRPERFAHVIIGDELTLAALAEYRGENWLDDCFPVNHRTNAVDVILSKLAFYEEMVAAGLSMPYAKLCHSWSEVETAAQQTHYPMILKTSYGFTGSSVRKIANQAELEPAFRELVAPDSALLVQQFCEGATGSTDVLFNHGVPMCWQSTYISECWPTPLAASSARTLMSHSGIEQMLSDVGRLTGFHGFASIDWIQEQRSNHIYLLELNPRPIPTYHLDKYFGIDFGASYKQLLSGQMSVTPPKSINQPAPVIKLFPQNLYWSISERNWGSFISCWHDAPWNDPLLLAAYLRRVFTHYLPKQWRETARRYLRKS